MLVTVPVVALRVARSWKGESDRSYKAALSRSSIVQLREQGPLILVPQLKGVLVHAVQAVPCCYRDARFQLDAISPR